MGTKGPYGPWAIAARALLAAAVASFMLVQVLHRPTPLGYAILSATSVLCVVLVWLFVKRLNVG